MRTTLTLDDDVANKLAELSRRTGKPFKQIVNDAIRMGLAVEKRSKKLPPFKVEAWDMGLRSEFNFDKVEDVFDAVEGPGRAR